MSKRTEDVKWQHFLHSSPLLPITLFILFIFSFLRRAGDGMLGCSSFPLALRVYPCQLDRKWLKESTAHQKTWGPEGSSGRGWLSNLKKKKKKEKVFFFSLWKTKLKWGRRAETRILALRTWFAIPPSNLTWSFCRKVSDLLLLASCTTGSWVYTWIASSPPPPPLPPGLSEAKQLLNWATGHVVTVEDFCVLCRWETHPLSLSWKPKDLFLGLMKLVPNLPSGSGY